MTNQKLIDHDKLINLSFILFLGTLSFITGTIIPSTQNIVLSGFKNSLFIITLLSYEWILLSYLSHYFAKSKSKIIEHFRKRKWWYFVGIYILGIVCYLIVRYENGQNILTILEDGLYWILIPSGSFLVMGLYDFFKEKMNLNTPATV